MKIQIHPVRTPQELTAIRELFEEYVASLHLDLSFQNFDDELTGLPGKYAPPAGELLLARTSDGLPIGCVGLRPFHEQGACEMKRLYVRPSARGAGVGRALITAVLHAGRAAGYREILLDTLASMREAVAMYSSFGFQEIASYNDSPLVDILFFGKRLAPPDAGPVAAARGALG